MPLFTTTAFLAFKEYGECQGKKHEISLVIIMDKVCMLIPIVGFEGGISCTGEKPPCKSLSCVTCQAMFMTTQIVAHWIVWLFHK